MTPITDFCITSLQLVVMRLLLQKIKVLKKEHDVNHKGFIATNTFQLLFHSQWNSHLLSIPFTLSCIEKGKSFVIFMVQIKGKTLLSLDIY